MPPLRAVFYPYGPHEELLKTAAFYFDEIFVLTPISVIGADELKRRLPAPPDPALLVGPQLQHPKISDLLEPDLEVIRLQQYFQLLIQEGVVKIVNPFDELRSLNLDAEFRSIIKANTEALTIRAGSLMDRAAADSSTLSRATDELTRAVARGSGPWEEAEEGSHREHVASYAAMFSMPVRSFARRPESGVRGEVCKLYRLRADVVRRVMYDSATLLAGRLSAIPLASSRVDEISYFGQMAAGTRMTSALSRRMPSTLEHAGKSYRVAQKAISASCPDLSSLTAYDILRLRQCCKEELQDFRVEIAKLAAAVSGPGDEISDTLIDDIVSREVVPSISHLARRLKALKEELPWRLLDRFSSLPSIASLAVTYVMGLPPYAGLALAAGIASTSAVLRQRSEEKKLRLENGLSFLLRLREKASEAARYRKLRRILLRPSS